MPHSVSTVLEVDGERVRVIRRRNQRRAYIRVKAPDGCVEVFFMCGFGCELALAWSPVRGAAVQSNV